MAAPLCSEDEFIELWNTHRGAAKVAEALQISKRNVLERRRAIERRRRISLEADDKRTVFYKHFRPVEHSARRSLTVQNGTVIVFSDAHFWPGVRTTAFRGLVKFIQEFKPAAVINNGDAFDGASISRFPRIMFLDAGPSVIQEMNACKERLGEIEEAANGARLLWALGNHDARFENRLAMNAPQFEGVEGFRLRDHFPQWAPCWSVWINDEVVVKHRYKNGIHATHNNAVWAGKTIITGHLHSLKVTPFDDYNGTRWGVDTGTLADPSGPQFQDYLEANPTNWRSGFVVLTFVDGQMLWPEIARVVKDGVIDFRGTLVHVPL